MKKTASGSFVSKETGIELIQNGDKLLVGNAAVEDRQFMQQVADELFNKKGFIAEDSLQHYVKMNSHLALSAPLFQNSFLEGNYFISGNFDKEAITFSTALSLKNNVNLSQAALCIAIVLFAALALHSHGHK